MMKTTLYGYFSLFASVILITYCGQTTYVPSPEFELMLRVSNPVNLFKLQLGINLHPSDSTCARMFVHRMNGPYSALDYRQPNAIRRNIADTLILSKNEYQKFYQMVAGLREYPFESENPSLQENYYSIHVKDKSLSVNVSAFESGDSPVNQLAEFLMTLFSDRYPEVSLWSAESKIRLIKEESGRVDSITIRHIEQKIEFFVNGNEKHLPDNHLMDLWSVLESNQVWKLNSDSTYRKYPLRYQLDLRRNELRANWEVYAPHLLSDKRYFDIINAVETLNIAGFQN